MYVIHVDEVELSSDPLNVAEGENGAKTLAAGRTASYCLKSGTISQIAVQLVVSLLCELMIFHIG